jgi:TPR repeat protein
MPHKLQPDSPLYVSAVEAFRGSGKVEVSPAKLAQFVKATRPVNLPKSERLRRLAIELELAPFADGWDGLRQIYDAAAAAAPADARIYHSRAIAAVAWLDPWSTPEPERRLIIAADAEAALARALDLSPDDSRIIYTMGHLYYNHPLWKDDPDGWAVRAAKWFERAARMDPENTIAQLYLAHCHHDRKDWSRAIAEYSKVDLVKLAEQWPRWRAWKCREQLCHCLAYRGDLEAAALYFRRFLDDLEALDDATLNDCVMNLNELVEALQGPLSAPELLQRTRALIQRLGREREYKGLFAE